MIDTLRLNLGRPVILDDTRLTFRARDIRGGQPIGDLVRFPKADGGEVEAGKVFFNSDLVNLETRYGQMFAQFSLPKYLAGGRDNVNPVSQDQAAAALADLQGYLADQAGVLADLEAASVARFDLFANADSKYAFTDYRSLFDLLDLKRQVKRDYGTTFFFANGQRETCIYDKRAEQAMKGNSLEGLPANLIRWEYRLKKGRVCKSALGIKKTGRLTALDLVKRWPDLVAIYDSQVKATLRLADSDRRSADAYNLKEELMALVKAEGPKGARTWVEWEGVRVILAKLGSLEVVRSVVREVLTDKQQVYRFMRWFTGVAEQLTFDFTKADINDLKRELYSKLSANYNLAA